MYNNRDPELFSGNEGDDEVFLNFFGGGGNDFLIGGPGNDQLRGGDDSDEIYGGSESDMLWGGPGGDRIYGGFGSDKIWGENGDDVIKTGTSGQYLIFPSSTGIPNGFYAEYVDGGNDDDTIDASEATSRTWLDVGPGTGLPGTYQFAYGGAYADMILGSDVDDGLIGAGGNDTIDGKARHDMIWGETGEDTLTGGAGWDWIWGGPDADTIDGGADDDMIYSGDFSMLIGSADQPYNGIAGAGFLPGPDMLGTGGGGNNTVDGHHEPVGGGGYGGAAGGMGGGATGLGNAFNGAAGAPLNVPAPGVLGNSSGKTAQLLQPPAYGTLTLNEDGSFTYTPDPEFAGVDLFLFVAIDTATSEASDPIPILLQIAGEAGSGPGDEPVAFEESVSAPVDGGAFSGALEYFENADTVQIVTGFAPEHGTLILNSDGSYTYTPDAGFVGVDSFQYVAVNSQTNEVSEPATVTIYVYGGHPGQDDHLFTGSGSSAWSFDAPGVLENVTVHDPA